MTDRAATPALGSPHDGPTTPRRTSSGRADRLAHRVRRGRPLDASVRSGPRSKGVEAWQTGRPVPIAVNSGRARFTVPTPRPASRTLVIVSALSRASGAVPDPAGGAARRDRSRAAARDRADRPAASTPAVDGSPCPRSRSGSTDAAAGRTFHLLVARRRRRQREQLPRGPGTAPRGRAAGPGLRRRAGRSAGSARTCSATWWRRSTAGSSRRPPATFGRARDVDGDGRFTVLMSSWLTRLAGGRHAVDGFVRGADFDATLAAPFGNRCDMMYLSTALEPGPHLRTVLAHEYTHAVTLCAKAFGAPTAGAGRVRLGGGRLARRGDGPPRRGPARVLAVEPRLPRQRLPVAARALPAGGRGLLRGRPVPEPRQPGRDVPVPPLVRRPVRAGPARRPDPLGPFGGPTWRRRRGRRSPSFYRDWSVSLFLNGLGPTRSSATRAGSINVCAAIDDWTSPGRGHFRCPRLRRISPGRRQGRRAATLVVGPRSGGPTRVYHLGAVRRRFAGHGHPLARRPCRTDNARSSGRRSWERALPSRRGSGTEWDAVRLSAWPGSRSSPVPTRMRAGFRRGPGHARHC